MDKICRFCGSVTQVVASLFVAENADLLAKAIAVYPLVLYEDDPLPKYVCNKCQTEIRTHYRNMKRVIKLNSNWIHSIRGYEEMSTYVELLDEIEQIKNSICKDNNLSVEGVLDQIVARMLHINKQKSVSVKLPPKKKKSVTPKPAPEKPKKRRRFDLSDDSDASDVSYDSDKTDESSNSSESSSKSLQSHNVNRRNSYLSKAGSYTSTKTTPLSNNDEISHAIIETTSNTKDNLTLTQLTKQENTCQYCHLVFQSLEDLVLHETNVHLKICLHQIFPKKRIQKSERKGLLVTNGAKRVIRCQSCFRVYENKVEILKHWKLCNCIFYCFVCSETFPNSPQLLHSHVRHTHGISHSYLKQVNENNHQGAEIDGTSSPAPRVERPNCAVRDWKVLTNDKTLQNKYMKSKIDSNVIVKNEPLDAFTDEAQLNRIKTEINPFNVTSSISTSTTSRPPVNPQKGLIKVKALEELLSTPAQLAMFSRVGIQKPLVIKEETPMDIVD